MDERSAIALKARQKPPSDDAVGKLLRAGKLVRQAAREAELVAQPFPEDSPEYEELVGWVGDALGLWRDLGRVKRRIRAA